MLFEHFITNLVHLECFLQKKSSEVLTKLLQLLVYSGVVGLRVVFLEKQMVKVVFSVDFCNYWQGWR